VTSAQEAIVTEETTKKIEEMEENALVYSCKDRLPASQPKVFCRNGCCTGD
jgi:hypothetical protein